MNEIVESLPNLRSGNQLSAAVAMRLFSVICGYRLVDALALMGGRHPLLTKVERTIALTTPFPVPVRVLTIYCWD